MTDFNAIFRPETEAEKQAATKNEERIESSKALYDSLNRGDYISAGKILQKAGSCEWDNITRHSSTGIPGIAPGVKDFEAHYSMDKDKTSVEIIERIRSGFVNVQDAFVPRVTVTDDSCTEAVQK
ncbi:hypothetical protein KA344_03495 [bacterium]|jgi:hypothetical protein|nr:hypothetical protein [bacterium]